MKTLYLVRHGKSSWRHKELRDQERPLKKRGAEDADLMAKHLNSKSIIPDLIISSPARRAFQTAIIFAENLKYAEDKIELNRSVYSSSYEELLAVVMALDDSYKSA